MMTAASGVRAGTINVRQSAAQARAEAMGATGKFAQALSPEAKAARANKGSPTGPSKTPAYMQTTSGNKNRRASFLRSKGVEDEGLSSLVKAKHGHVSKSKQVDLSTKGVSFGGARKSVNTGTISGIGGGGGGGR
jgi:hypothetical protein